MSQSNPQLERISRYFDGQLPDDEARALNDWIKADPSHAQLFAWFSIQHRRTIDCLRRAELNAAAPWELHQPQLISADLIAALEGDDDPPVLRDLTERFLKDGSPIAAPALALPRNDQANRGPRVLVIPTWVAGVSLLAAAALIAFAFVVVFANGPDSPTPLATQPAPPEPQSVTPTPSPSPDPFSAPPAPAETEPVYARLVDAHQARWLGGTGPKPGSDVFPAGLHRLQQGYIRLGYDNGTEVIVQGPATIQIDADNRLNLTDGIASAYVPQAGHGFIIATPAGDIIDVGTEFGVHVVNPFNTEVHVLTGEVYTIVAGNEQARPLLAGQSLNLDRSESSFNAIAFRGEKFLRDWERAGEGVTVDDSCRYLFNPPVSLELNQLEHSDEVYLLRERAGLILQEDLAVNARYTPGQRTSDFGPSTDIIPAGTKVDVYIIHFEQPGRDNTRMEHISGFMDFNRPILGLITDGSELIETHPTLGHPDVRYEMMRSIGIEGNNNAKDSRFWDELLITSDGDALSYKLQSRESIDSFRIIVTAE